MIHYLLELHALQVVRAGRCAPCAVDAMICWVLLAHGRCAAHVESWMLCAMRLRCWRMCVVCCSVY